MSLLDKFVSKNRVRAAARRVAKSSSARNYASLAHEHGVLGNLSETLRVCQEGLELFPGDTELKRLADRSRALLREGRVRALQAELRDAPRPALWRELCGILLESGRVGRAEEAADEWFAATGDGEPALWRARARAERFFADRRRDDGRKAFDLVEAAAELLPHDVRPLRLHLSLASRVGAWADARRVLARLLELNPGDPQLEARFRTVLALSENAKTRDQALIEVERTGRLADDEDEQKGRGPATGSVRPLLKRLAAEEGVQAAFYVRGATALVQGPKGPTAERTARGIREVVQSCQGAARRMGLGQALEVRMDGEFGTLLVAPDEMGAGALWCTGEVSPKHEESLRALLDVAGLARGGARS